MLITKAFQGRMWASGAKDFYRAKETVFTEPSERSLPSQAEEPHRVSSLAFQSLSIAQKSWR